MCKLSKEEFLDRTPGCVGDILYEHLQLLQQDAEERSESEFANNNIKHNVNHSHTSSPQPQQQQQGDLLYEELQLLQQDPHAIKPVMTKIEPQQSEFVDRYDDARLNYSPPMSSYEAYGNVNALYAAMAVCRPPYPQSMSGQPFSMYSDHYQLPQHSSYSTPFFHNQVSFFRQCLRARVLL
jgi:Sterile alpha motif (SAM)/Pointed domain